MRAGTPREGRRSIRKVRRAQRPAHRGRTLAVAALLTPFILAPADDAAMPPALRLLAQKADVVALITCETTESAWDVTDPIIVTRVMLRADQSLKGEVSRTLVVHTLGGQVDRHGMGASHAAAFVAGERTVVFLRRSAHGPYYVLVNGAAGKLALDGAGRLQGAAAGADISTVASWIDATSEAK